MSDILIICKECGKQLATDEKTIGRKFNCPSCEEIIKIPSPIFSFDCPKCNENLSVSKGVEGGLFYCPSCNNRIAVPLKDPKKETKSIPEIKEISNVKTETKSGLVRREMRSDGIIPVAQLANGDELMEKHTKKIGEAVMKLQAKRQKEALKPLFIALKILAGLVILGIIHIIFDRIFGHPWLANGMMIVVTCIFLPLYFRAKWLCDN